MKLEHRFVGEIPDVLDNDVLYISLEHRTTIHKCCCGCDNETVLPLSPSEWKLTFDGESISMNPSVGNWNFPCRSHYWIRSGQIRWAEQWSDEQIAAGQARERRRFEARLPKRVHDEKSISIPEVEKSSFWAYLRSTWSRIVG